ncbi:MAG: efflux transporter outer membrane subunit [bacterium]|nr:efflux transporter outer membrane subunit [bacterium]
MRRVIHRLTPLLLMLSVACTVGPDYEPPEITVPDVWHEAALHGVVDGEAQLHTWWTQLDDPLLEELIVRAERANFDLQRAVGRIRESRALVRVNSGQKWPEVGVSADASRSQASDNGTATPPPGGFDDASLYNAGFDAAWELDLFGRIRRGVEAASAQYEASIEDYRDVLVTLFADVAFNYIDVRASQARLRYAWDNLTAQQGMVQLTQDRFDAGLVSGLDVSQAESNLAQTEASIPLIETALTQALNRLAVLLGEHPGALHDELEVVAPILNPPREVVIGLPGDLLRQRPDVRRAERDLAAQTARIGVAVADLYPRFSLTGFFGLQSVSFDSFADGDSVTWSFGLPFSWNLFDRGRRGAVVDAERARTDQLLAAYQQTVLLALEEVENSLVSYDRQQLRSTKLRSAAEATERSLELVRTQYMTGLADFQNVLDTQRTLFSQQDQLATAEGLVLQNLIALYKALGGGWAEDPEQPEHFTVGAIAPEVDGEAAED